MRLNVFILTFLIAGIALSVNGQKANPNFNGQRPMLNNKDICKKAYIELSTKLNYSQKALEKNFDLVYGKIYNEIRTKYPTCFTFTRGCAFLSKAELASIKSLTSNGTSFSDAYQRSYSKSTVKGGQCVINPIKEKFTKINFGTNITSIKADNKYARISSQKDKEAFINNNLNPIYKDCYEAYRAFDVIMSQNQKNLEVDFFKVFDRLKQRIDRQYSGCMSSENNCSFLFTNLLGEISKKVRNGTLFSEAVAHVYSTNKDKFKNCATGDENYMHAVYGLNFTSQQVYQDALQRRPSKTNPAQFEGQLIEGLTIKKAGKPIRK